MRRLLAFVAAALLLAPALPSPAVLAFDDEGRFLLGVLRRDGLVMPFAAFDGKRWSTPWPAEVRSMDIPITLADVPDRWWGRAGPQAGFTRWVNGVRSGAVTLDKPAMIPMMCSVRLVLRSDYKSAEPLPPPIEQPYPKDGLVVSGDQAILPLPPVPRTSSEWSASAVVLLEEFNRAEDEAITAYYDWRHPVKRSERRRLPIEIEALYRVPMEEEGWAAYYVEAVRRYPPGPEDAGCGLVTFVSGWIRLGPKGRPLYDIGGRVTYCDRRGVSYMLPFGVLRADRKAFWIYQMSGYDREWFVVARPTPQKIELHAEYPAGLCPR